MPKWVAIGRRRYDFGLMIDFSRKRAMVRANTKWIEGVPLEEIPPGVHGFYQALVLIHRNWKNLYFVIEREGWDEDDYFLLAERRFREKGIKKP